jgi:drug/metabolite transporter (DMT)-like permease
MVALAFAAIYLVWGTSYLAIRVGVQSIPPLMLMGVRCTTAGVLLLAFAAWRGERIPLRSWGRAAVAGGLMFGLSYGLLAWAEQRITSGVAALLGATVPFWLTVFEWRRARPSAVGVAGLALGVAGVGVLVAGDLRLGAALVPVGAVLVAEVAWAAGALYGRPPRLPDALVLRAGMPMVSGGLLLLVVSFVVREPARFSLATVSAASVAALLYLIVFASIVAFCAYAWLLNVAPVSRVGTHAYVNPVVAVLVGSGVAGEPLTAALVVGAIVIAAGVAMVLVSGPAAS